MPPRSTPPTIGTAPVQTAGSAQAQVGAGAPAPGQHSFSIEALLNPEPPSSGSIIPTPSDSSFSIQSLLNQDLPDSSNTGGPATASSSRTAPAQRRVRMGPSRWAKLENKLRDSRDKEAFRSLQAIQTKKADPERYHHFLELLEKGQRVPGKQPELRVSNIEEFRNLTGADRKKLRDHLDHERVLKGGERAVVERVEELLENAGLAHPNP